MEILIADKFPEERLSNLRELGVIPVHRPKVDAAEFKELLATASVLVVRSRKVPAEAIEAAPRLSLIIRAGAGVDNIDVDAASARGIYVANCPGKNSVAVAELVMGLMLAVDRRIPDAVAEARAGQFNKTEYSNDQKARGLAGRNLGLLGFGAIAREVAVRALSFDMTVRAWSRSLTDERAAAAGISRARTPEELCAYSDILSIHLAKSPETKGFVSDNLLFRLPQGAMVINTARSEVIDAGALRRAIDERQLRVATDVPYDEPKVGRAPLTDPLAQLPGVYVTPHIGASTSQAQDAVADETVRIVKEFLKHGLVPNCVNVARSPASYQLVVRHHDRVGVLANVMTVLKKHDINVEEMENTVFRGAKAACAKIKLTTEPSAQVIEEIVAQKADVLNVDVIRL
jgi:D-3-phosphoglycerate dehydrogenase